MTEKTLIFVNLGYLAMFYCKYDFFKAAADTKTENKNVKDAMIPAELNTTVEEIKKHIKVSSKCCTGYPNVFVYRVST